MSYCNKIYLKTVDQIPLLSEEEEKVLTEKAFKGDKLAKKRLVEANLRFVIKIANEYRASNMEIDDLITAGNIGLMRAADKFNPSRDNKFLSYAVWWIRSFIHEEIRKNGFAVKIPAYRYGEKKYEEWKSVSLNQIVKDTEGECSMLSILKDDKNAGPEANACSDAVSKRLYEYLDFLNSVEREILILRNGLSGKEPMSLAAVAEVVGYSKERVRQLEGKAILKLRSIARKEGDISEGFNLAA